MKHESFKEEKDLIASTTDFPSVSVILPLENGFSRQKQLLHQLNSAKAQVKKTLAVFYPEQQAELVLNKLDQLTQHIEAPGSRKSVILFASPKVEKVVFLNSPVSPRIIIDHSFEIRDLVNEHLLDEESLVLLLSGEKAILYHRKQSQLTQINFSVPWHVAAYKNDAPEKVANFSDPQKRKEVLLDKFLHHIDQGLGIALKSYPLPVHLIAPHKVAGHFKKITKHLSSIISSIHGNYMEATPAEIIKLLQIDKEPANSPGTDWKQEIERAAGEKKLALGIREAWAGATNKNAKLLLVEEDYALPVHDELGNSNIYGEDVNVSTSVHIKDAVGDIIEKVITCGGDIRFVEHNALQDFGHIALIQYYQE